MKTMTVEKKGKMTQEEIEKDEVYKMFMRALDDLRHGRVKEWKL